MSARPIRQHFLNRRKTKELFRNVFALGKGKKWNLTHSDMFLDFLAGNQEFHCTPWGMPTRNVFGWQKPCYLLGEGYAKTFAELMETTDWDAYGTGRYEKCANCMAHCGYEATATEATVQRPLAALALAWRGVTTEGTDGAGNPAREPAPGAVRVRRPGAAEVVGNPRQRGAREIRQGSGEDRGERGLDSAAIDARHFSVGCAGRAPASRPEVTLRHIPYATARVLPRLRLR